MNVNITGPRILAEFSFFGLCDVTITQTTLTSLLVLAAVTILCWRLGRNLRKRRHSHQEYQGPFQSGQHRIIQRLFSSLPLVGCNDMYRGGAVSVGHRDPVISRHRQG